MSSASCPPVNRSSSGSDTGAAVPLDALESSLGPLFGGDGVGVAFGERRPHRHVVGTEQSELAREAFDEALANMRELAEIAAKSQSEAFDIIRSRVEQRLSELLPGRKSD